MIATEQKSRSRTSYRIEKRSDIGSGWSLLSTLIALILSIGISSILISMTGSDAKDVLWSILKGSFGSKNAIIDTLIKSVPILITGLATIISYRAKVWNIGQEGQLYAGAMAVTFVLLTFPGLSLPSLLFIPLLLIVAMIGGAVWGGIAGVLKARFKVNEIIVTVMMNYIILYLCTFLLGGFWQEPGTHYYNTIRFPDATFLPTLFGTRLHIGFVIALVLVFVIYFLLWRTKHGYEIRALGYNPVASLYKGINIKQTILMVMLVSGAISGLAGGIQVLAVNHRLLYGFSDSFGFTGILIALLGRLNPFGVLLAAIFFGALENGSSALLIYSNVPRELVTVIMGLIIIMMLLSEAVFKYRIRRVNDAE